MVIHHQTTNRHQRGSLLTELLVAISILAIAVLPLAYSIASEKRLAHACYEHAVAMEIIDGEMEVLLAGGWREFTPGTHDYPAHANAARNLASGRFLVTIAPTKVRLEWIPAEKHHGGIVMREGTVK
jgi:hypothetical protein